MVYIKIKIMVGSDYLVNKNINGCLFFCQSWMSSKSRGQMLVPLF